LFRDSFFVAGSGVDRIPLRMRVVCLDRICHLTRQEDRTQLLCSAGSLYSLREALFSPVLRGT
jgi:hypothetical protein